LTEHFVLGNTSHEDIMVKILKLKIRLNYVT